MPGKPRISKGTVEREAMAIQLCFSEGAIHIPEQCRQASPHRPRLIGACTLRSRRRPGALQNERPCDPLALLSQPSEQRWQLPAPIQINPELRSSGLSDPLLAVLQRRGYEDAEAITALLEPPDAPDPRRHFPDLGKAVQRLRQACKAVNASPSAATTTPTA